MTIAAFPNCRITLVLGWIAPSALLAASVAAAGAQTITVTTLNDTVDFVAPQQAGDLPGPDGLVSFREALTAANNTPGPQTVHFAIPQSEWWLYSDRAILRQEDGIFALNDDQTTVDFTTQTLFTGDTNPSGWEVGIYGLQPNAWGVAAIYVNGDNCLIKGLDRVMQRGYGVRITGNNNRVIGCTISGPLYAGVMVQGNVGEPATGNIVGGIETGEGNVLSAGNSGVRIDGPTDTTVVIGNALLGSRFAGVEVRGASCCPEYTPFNTRIGGPTAAERNWIADNGRFGEEGFPEGDQVKVEWAFNTIVQGNYIGTTEDGAAAYPGAHGTAGVSVRESNSTIIRNNLVSGIRKVGTNHYAGQVFGTGIVVRGPNTGVEITGNLVGVDAAGTNAVPNLNGITLAWFQGYPSGAQIGGTDSGTGNIVAFNERTGITINTGITGVTIERNSIHSNGLLGIDLLPGAGVTPNDPGDGDTGGNDLQNFPVLSSAQVTATSTSVQGTINSTANTPLTLEFFSTDVCDASGHGEGQQFLGFLDVTTDAGGDAAFSVTLPIVVPSGSILTVTATNPSGSTSEFSPCATVASTASPGDVNGDGTVNADDLIAVILAFGRCPTPPEACPADLNHSGAVDVDDMVLVILHWH